MDTLVVDGMRICYTAAGSGPPLLLIHGLGANRSDWDSQIPEFSKHYRVIAPDLPGYGDSAKPLRLYSVPYFAQLMWQLCDRLGLEQISIVGHSMGGATALQMAVDAPDRVERMVIANSVPTFTPRHFEEYREFALRMGLMTVFGPRLLATFMSRRMFPRADQTAQRERSIARSKHNHRHTYLVSLLALARWSVRADLPKLRIPTLVIAAEKDYFPFEDVQQFASELPLGELQAFPGTRHGLPMEVPEAFNESVLGFLLREPAPAVRRRRRKAAVETT